MSSSWPPALKTYVNKTFANCNDSNRSAVETELKALIFKAFESNTLWTIDWENITLTSLTPKKRKQPVFQPSSPHTYGSVPSLTATIEDDRRDKRARRFENPNSEMDLSSRLSGGNGISRLVQGGVDTYSYSANGGSNSNYTPEPEGIRDPNVIDWDRHTIVGTSTKVEKPFLRLTSLPDPKTIRPLSILKQTLEVLKTKWREESNYGFICDQFKSMRQDLTVQRLKTDFTVTVYEIHARIALEKGDLPEFNQCQGQLRELYKYGLGTNQMEFLGYRILYLIFAKNRAELNSTLADLTPMEKSDISVIHAIAVRQAVSFGNYNKFFKLFLSAPKMGAYLMDHFVSRERINALLTMCKAFKQGIPLSMISSQLGFDSETETHQFLIEYKLAIYKPFTANSTTSRLVDPKLIAGFIALAQTQFNKVDIKGSFS